MKTPVEEHFDIIASKYDYFKEKNWYYYENLKALYAELILPEKTVLEIGCGTGDLLSLMKAQKAVGIDISSEMVAIASEKHPHISFEATTIENFHSDLSFDYIYLADVIEHLEDVPSTMEALGKICDEKTKIIFTYANPLWEPLLMLLEKLNMKMPEGPHYRIPYFKFKKIIDKNGLKTTDRGWRLIFPAYIPYFSNFFNNIFKHIPLIKRLSMLEYVILEKR